MTDNGWYTQPNEDDRRARVREERERIEKLWGGRGGNRVADGHGHVVTRDGLNAEYLREPGRNGERGPVLVDQQGVRERTSILESLTARPTLSGNEVREFTRRWERARPAGQVYDEDLDARFRDEMARRTRHGRDRHRG